MGQRTPGNTNQSEDSAISGDGRYVTFWSNAKNLDASNDGDGYDTNDDYDVFVFDRQTLTTEVVSMNLSGETGPFGGPPLDRLSAYPCISRAGRYISFVSLANDLVTNDTNSGPDIFVRDTWTSQTILVNLGPTGQATNVPGVVDNGTMTGDGRFLTFYSGGTEYGDIDTNGYWDVYLIDRDKDGNGIFDELGKTRTRRVSVGPNNQQGNEQSVASSLMATISKNGRFVVFESLASNFSGQIPDTRGVNARYDVFVRELRKVLQGEERGE